MTLLEIDIIQLSESMTHSKKDFLAFIAYYLGDNSDDYHEANRLILTRKDILKWIDLWDGNIDEVHNVNRLLRQQKIIENQTFGYEEFKDLLYLDKEDFITTYFQQVANERTIGELDYLLNALSVSEMFYIHKQNPSIRIEYINQLNIF